MNCLFCDFLKNNMNHINGYPFLPIHETKNTISFLSIPENIERHPTHILIIPKKHYEFLEKVPESVLNELIKHTQLACEVLRKDFPACRIQLNNGKEAEQYISHVHFHISPFTKRKQTPFPTLLKTSLENFIKTTEILKEKFKQLSQQK